MPSSNSFTIKQATTGLLPTITDIVQDTISKIYPHYYPCGAVDYFRNLHSTERIATDITAGNVFLVFETNAPFGTVTIQNNHILRLFVSVNYQRRGIGRSLLDFAEDRISENYSEILIDASFPAKQMYLRRGYIDTEYHTIQTDNGDYLCYDVMKKSCEKRFYGEGI